VKINVAVDCCLCSNTHRTSINIPENWSHIYGGIDDEQHAFCPAHSDIMEFVRSQCSGCVGGWGDCGLWRAFAYSKLDLTNEDFLSIEKGICPKRVNGTFGFSQDGIEKIDLSQKVSVKSGVALSIAIKEYAEKYHTKRETRQ
jgi:hypothetical protein